MAKQEAQRSFEGYPPRNGYWKFGVWVGRIAFFGTLGLGVWKAVELIANLVLWIYGN